MGGGRSDSKTWADYRSTHVDNKSRAEVFTSTTAKAEQTARDIKIRESRDSHDNPESTPIILALDVTGSMGQLAHALMIDGFDKLMRGIYDRKPVSDPHIMVMAIGDCYTDAQPVQATQFEADIRIGEQTKELFLEGNGGGNGGESYSSAHIFAALKTSHDCFEKRGKKGYLFTVGDEPCLDGLTVDQIKAHIGINAEVSISAKEAIAMASRTYEIFHIVITEGYYCKAHGADFVVSGWKDLLPERVLPVDDHTKIAEVIISAIQVLEGMSHDQVAKSWSGNTSLVVASAIQDVVARPTGTGVARL